MERKFFCDFAKGLECSGKIDKRRRIYYRVPFPPRSKSHTAVNTMSENVVPDGNHAPDFSPNIQIVLAATMPRQAKNTPRHILVSRVHRVSRVANALKSPSN
jgi:hypothetical protein